MGSSDASALTPPIVIDNPRDGGVSFFRSVEALERQLEPWYPREEEFVAFDSVGRAVEITVEERQRRGWFGRTVSYEAATAVPLEATPTHADQLRASLVAQLRRQQAAGTDVDNAPLADLLVRAMEIGDVQ